VQNPAGRRTAACLPSVDLLAAASGSSQRCGFEHRTTDKADLLARATKILQQRLGVDVDVELCTADHLLSQSTSVAKFARVVKE
jgi:hypothetical protein